MGSNALELHFGGVTLGARGGLLAMVSSLLGSEGRLHNVGGSVLRTNLVLQAHSASLSPPSKQPMLESTQAVSTLTTESAKDPEVEEGNKKLRRQKKKRRLRDKKRAADAAAKAELAAKRLVRHCSLTTTSCLHALINIRSDDNAPCTP